MIHRSISALAMRECVLININNDDINKLFVSKSTNVDSLLLTHSMDIPVFPVKLQLYHFIFPPVKCANMGIFSENNPIPSSTVVT